MQGKPKRALACEMNSEFEPSLAWHGVFVPRLLLLESN